MSPAYKNLNVSVGSKKAAKIRKRTWRKVANNKKEAKRRERLKGRTKKERGK